MQTLGRGQGALTSTSSAPESSASQEATRHSEGLHVQLFLLRPGGSPAGHNGNTLNTMKNPMRVPFRAEPSLTWVSGPMKCCHRSIWLCCSTCRPGSPPPGHPGSSQPPMSPPSQQLQVTHTNVHGAALLCPHSAPTDGHQTNLRFLL